MILLDTTILISLHEYVLAEDEDYGASLLSRAELEWGVLRASTTEEASRRRRRLAGLDLLVEWLHFDIQSSTAYGAVAEHARVSGVTGSKLRGKDALIAAQAYRFGTPVMTSNLPDFRVFEPLITVRDPRSPQ